MIQYVPFEIVIHIYTISLTSEKTHERNTAVKLRKYLDSFEFVVFIVLWERILRAFNSSSKEPQSPRMDLSGDCRLLNCTKNQLQYTRENWDAIVETATAISRSWNIKAIFSCQNNAARTLNANGCSTSFVNAFKVNIFYRTIDIGFV